MHEIVVKDMGSFSHAAGKMGNQCPRQSCDDAAASNAEKATQDIGGRASRSIMSSTVSTRSTGRNVRIPACASGWQDKDIFDYENTGPDVA